MIWLRFLAAMVLAAMIGIGYRAVGWLFADPLSRRHYR